MSSLDGKTYSSNAAIQFAIQFDRPQYGHGNTINYQNSQIKLEIFSKKTLALTLTLGSGLTRTFNASNQQSVVGQIEVAQIETLLGTTSKQKFNYAWTITPPGGYETRKPEGGNYTGSFEIIRDNQAGLPAL